MDTFEQASFTGAALGSCQVLEPPTARSGLEDPAGKPAFMLSDRLPDNVMQA
jgi:hypothetical protein